MKAITINVSEPVYTDFQQFAKSQDRTTSEVIREAMLQYRETRIQRKTCLLPLRPVSVGKILKPWISREDLLEDFWERNDRD